MSSFGVERIAIYTPRFSVSAVELAAARGRDPEAARARYLLDTRSVAPPYEDTVTMATNAARQVLSSEDASAVRLLIVATESGIDFGKPISTWVHRHCGLPAECRNFEIKHACFGGTAALKTAIALLMTEGRRNAKALVICSDLTRPFPQEGYDFAGGAVAVALLVSDKAGILKIDMSRCGYWTLEVADTFRPTASSEIGDNQLSLCTYLDALDGAYDNYLQQAGACNYDSDFHAHIYHAPFPGMTREAHKCLLARDPTMNAEKIADSFQSKVLPGLTFARKLGTAYGASNFVSLFGVLRECQTLAGPNRVSIYSYGSGCQAEFYEGIVPEGAGKAVDFESIDCQLATRKTISVEEYDQMARARQAQIDQPCFHALSDPGIAEFEELYVGRHLLFLEGVKDFRRNYAWS
ncbi:MAG: hydroxymethylglutaryl-CoA synthase [Terracidiphilus sp.]